MNVVLAEPDSDYARVVAGVLEMASLAVHVVSDATSLLMAARQGVAAAVVSGDLPGQPPLRVLAALRELDVPTLYVLARPDSVLEASLRAAGAIRVLTRPFPLFDLADLVRSQTRGATPRVGPPAPPGDARPSGLGVRTHSTPSRAPAAPGSSGRATEGPVDRGNLGIIARLWARQASGVLIIDDAWRASFCRGAPVGDPSGLARALRGGVLRFEPGDVQGSPDRDAFGARLWRLASDVVTEAERNALADAVLFPGAWPEAIAALPVPLHARAAFRAIRGRTSLIPILENQRLDRAEVLGGLAVLVALGLLSVERERSTSDFTRRGSGDVTSDVRRRTEPTTSDFKRRAEPTSDLTRRAEPTSDLTRRAGVASDAARRPAAGESTHRSEAITADFTRRGESAGNTPGPLPRGGPSDVTSNVGRGAGPPLALVNPLAPLRPRPSLDGERSLPDRLLPGGPPARPRSSLDGDDRGAPSVVTAPERPAPAISTATHRSHEPSDGSAFAASGDSGVPTGSRTGGRQAVGAALRNAAAVMGTSSLRTNLTREVELFRTASAWTVLSVPPKTPPAMVKQAGARMVQRYEQLRRHPDAEVRRLAGLILDRVHAAIAQTSVEAADDLSLDVASPDDEVFQLGLKALRGGDWAAAERAFSRARDIEGGSARNLAYLGWARYNNPGSPQAERQEDGEALLRLAEQFDPRYPDAQMFLATIHLRRGEETAALRRARIVLRHDPAHADAAALVRRLSRTSPAT